MSEKLKPCPFCGGEAVYFQIGEIVCESCATCINEDTTEKAIAAWNKRAGRNATLEDCAKLCEKKVARPAGYHGQWEGYGASMGDKTGTECAIGIRSMKEA